MKYSLTDDFAELKAERPTTGQVEFWDEHMPGFLLRVSMGGTKVWQIVYRKDDRKRRVNLGRYPRLKCELARKRAAKLFEQIEQGKDPFAEKIEADNAPTFAELATKYLDEWAKPRKRTWSQDEQKIKSILLPEWGARKARDVTPREVVALLDKLVARGASIRANRLLSLISKIYKFGLGKFVVDQNPARDVLRPGVEHKRDRVLNEDELRRVWSAADEALSPKVAVIFKLALLTAQRKGEISGMAWAELDLDAGWWTIPAERAKNNLAHRVPLTPQVVAILIARRDAANRDPVFVFLGRRQNQAIDNLSKPIDAVRAEAKVDFRFHDLRRTAASHMTSAGIPRFVVSKILNHVEQGVTAIYDRHSYDGDKRAALLKWDRRLAEIISGEKPGNVIEGVFVAA